MAETHKYSRSCDCDHCKSKHEDHDVFEAFAHRYHRCWRSAHRISNIIEACRIAGRAHGYAVGVHGSLMRDLDLMAAPWTETAADPDVLAQAIAQELNAGGKGGYHLCMPGSRKPHGRMAYIIHFWAPNDFGPTYIDLSVLAPHVPLPPETL
ncbi:MAG TPA: hypothetical protein VGH91_04550 [Gammaproteobacteria bacterium]|jgi:hypothetical protein